ncbi:TOM1-like protein 2 [Schistosoma haematobium]|uniref:TOM1-like protein 2 n=1 Tax=Schistosoma haematobium TaxID=6185 RepID=A0A922LFL2_SCHHA|nr:TOM1-like protein 2 [Schistosoma haematobium]KAH9581845.1 TOM1-like protein 2 [Schistosoma haematobium]
MQNIFQPHPFSTTIGTLTERATDSGQPSEDWALILEICDTVNETDDGPKEAIRAIKKRLVTSAGKDNVSIWYTLTLLETLVKNCGKRFHSQVANKEFLHAFLKLLSPKNDPPQQLQTKVLYMLKCWISSNWDVAGKRDLEKIYASLLQKGVQFPTVAPVDCYASKPSRGLRDNLVTSKTGVTIPRTCSQENDKLTGRSLVLKSSGTESDIHLRNHLSVNPSSSSVLHPCSVCHCIHESNIQSLACHNLGSRPNVHPTGNSVSSYSRSTRNVHFNGTIQNRSQISTIPNDCTVMVVNSDHQPSTLTYPHPSHTHCLSLSNNKCQQMNTNYSMNSNNPNNNDEMEFDEDGIVRHLNTSQRIKLTEDLSIVETNINVLNDLLAELRPDTITIDDLNLLKELNCTCRIMHQRVMEFLSQVSDEEVINNLIQVNDHLTNTLLRYDRFERYYQRAIQNSDNNNSNNQQMDSALCLTNSRPQLCLTASSSDHIDSSRHRSNHHHHYPQQQHHHHHQQLAITAGPSSLRRTTLNESTVNGVVSSRMNSLHYNHADSGNGSSTAVSTTSNHHNNNEDEDDDESLLDISEGPHGGSTTRSHDSDETDEIAKWLSSRQLIPVNSQQQSQHSHRPFQHQQQSLTTNSRSHSCVRTNHLSAITNTTTTTTTAGVSLYATQNPSNKSVHSHQSFHELL